MNFIFIWPFTFDVFD